MIANILSHTPAWVFVLFVVLVAAGARLARANRVSLLRLLFVPVAMAALSLSSLVQSFGLASAATATWLALVAAAVVAALATAPRSDVQYSIETRSFSVPGSWLPLALMMSIFFTRYVVAVLLAIHPVWHGGAAFAAVVGAAYGMTSGAFVWRALRIGRVATRRPAGRPASVAAVLVA